MRIIKAGVRVSLLMLSAELLAGTAWAVLIMLMVPGLGVHWGYLQALPWGVAVAAVLAAFVSGRAAPR